MARARHPGWVFEQLDLVSDAKKIETFDFDVFMIRDVIQHVPIEQAVRAFDNLRNSNIKYIIVSNWRTNVNLAFLSVNGTKCSRLSLSKKWK